MLCIQEIRAIKLSDYDWNRPMDRIEKDILVQSGEFWNGNPCDGQADIQTRSQFRYRKEPWLPPLLDEITAFPAILEIGCGQGTDALYCCQRMKKGGAYTGIDLSVRSIEMAVSSAEALRDCLYVFPVFRQGNAEQLDFTDESFDCVVSTGVLHHTDDFDRALSEVHRVLRKGGLAVISLYRFFSPKLLVAQSVRKAVCATGLRNFLMKRLHEVGSNHFLGTMLHECVGVPILRSFTKQELIGKFSGFSTVRIEAAGVGFSLFGLNRFFDTYARFLGAMWIVRATK